LGGEEASNSEIFHDARLVPVNLLDAIKYVYGQSDSPQS
jgi:hypothetical protein